MTARASLVDLRRRERTFSERWESLAFHARKDVERALATLAEDQRAALLLVVLEGLTYREVAEVQGVPIGTVMSRLARARAQIKAYLDGERPALRRIK